MDFFVIFFLLDFTLFFVNFGGLSLPCHLLCSLLLFVVVFFLLLFVFIFYFFLHGFSGFFFLHGFSVFFL